MSQTFSWDAPPLSAEDERLIEAYLRGHRTLDDLPYTPEFDRLVAEVSQTDTPETRHALFKRLFTLRKMGRLPRVASLE